MFDFIKKTIHKNTLKSEDSQQAAKLEAAAKEVMANYPQGRGRNELIKFQHHGDTVTLDLDRKSVV